jgi:hypothetical protein
MLRSFAESVIIIGRRLVDIFVEMPALCIPQAIFSTIVVRETQANLVGQRYLLLL